MVAVVALYRDWPPLLAAVAFVLFEHGVAGAIAPDVVFDGPAVYHHPWLWASLHAGAVLGVAAAGVAAWGITEAEHAARLAERDRAEAALRTREAEFRTLVENAPDVVLILDHAGVVRFVMPAIRTVLGYDPDTFADGDDAYLQIMGGFIGAALANAAACEAVSAAREAAEQADALKTTFLLTMSHELRTPLTAIMGYADILLDGLSGGLTPTQAEDVGSIAGGANRLLRLVDDLPDLANISAGRLDLMPEPTRIASILAEVREDVAPQAAANGIALEFAVAADVPSVLADSGRLRQALLNLVGNAVTFTDKGAVTVRATAEDGIVAVSVGDTGIGIAPDDVPRLFDRFWQADGSSTRRHGGVGLGLAIARQLAESHGGTISVASVPGEGSTFTVRLPITPTRPDTAYGARPPQTASPARPTGASCGDARVAGHGARSSHRRCGRPHPERAAWP